MVVTVETSTRESGKWGFICCRTWIMLYISVIVYACVYEEKIAFSILANVEFVLSYDLPMKGIIVLI